MLTSSVLVLALVGVAPSENVDQQLAISQRAAGVQPVALCTDETFLRRISLDLIGRIPTREELRRFRAEPDRAAKIEELLASPEFPRFWSEVWTSGFIGYATQRFRASREPLRAWLEQSLRDDVGYDRIARQLIAAEGDSAFDGPVNFLVRHREQPTVKVSRMFLGVRLDCARCHDHPFAKWTREDYDSFTRFFAGANFTEASERNIRVTETPRQAGRADRPRFLSGARPQSSRWRDELALFVTTCRPFARNYANRIWYQLLGRGIVHPPDDFSANTPAAPELLEHLTNFARESKFNVRSLVRLICNSEAYQRESGHAKQSQASHALFASYTPKPLTIEQQVSSLAVAFRLKRSELQRQTQVLAAVRDSLDEDFSETWAYRDTVQDVMNRLVQQLPTRPAATTGLYEQILSRSPTPRELELCAGRSTPQVIFALTHSNEFRFNH